MDGSLAIQYSNKSEVVFDPDGLNMLVEITEFATEKCLPIEINRNINSYLGLKKNNKSGGKKKEKEIEYQKRGNQEELKKANPKREREGNVKGIVKRK